MTILYFVIALGVLVFVHEFGHFYAAKKQGIGVEVFSIGFGPKLISFRRGETQYTISLLPFGGYVKMMGEDPNDPDPTIPAEKSYSKKPIWRRSIVVFAGPFMNLVLASVVMPVIFMIGRMEPIYLDQKPVVVGVKHESPAEKAGLQTGDEIVSMTRGSEEEKFEDWKSLMNYIMLHADESVDVRIKRADEFLTKKLLLIKTRKPKRDFRESSPAILLGMIQ
ncbi:MAG: site-2 protease family protein [Deltaproteobacteria bacterium]|nr:MAG: site-2 protease family protein [Deltaproteobacteria bacterium]